jgi:hypothetical protein
MEGTYRTVKRPESNTNVITASGAFEEAKRRLALRRVGVLVLAGRAEDVSELGQLLTSGLQGNLLGDSLGRVQSLSR